MRKNRGKSKVAQSRVVDRSVDRRKEYALLKVPAGKVETGKYKGTRYKDLPQDYVEWGAFHLEDCVLRDRLVDELLRRKL